MIFERANFISALPIWEKGTERVQNCTLLFTSTVKNTDSATLRISGASIYNVFINGKFLSYGPARAGRGYCRVDEIPIGDRLTEEQNIITVISSGYNCNSYYVLNEPSFLCAEVVSGDEVLCATGAFGWRAYAYESRVRRAQRYTFQRTFCEVYDFIATKGEYASHVGHREVEVGVVGSGEFIARGVSLPDFERECAEGIIERGSVSYNDRDLELPSIMQKIGNTVTGYTVEELDVFSIALADKLDLITVSRDGSSFPVTLGEDEYAMAKMRGNRTGLITLSVECLEDTELYLTFDEILSDGVIDYRRGDCSNVVIYKLKGGKRYELVTAEPYTFQYINMIVTKGKARLFELGVIRIGFNEREISARLDTDRADDAIKRIYSAAVETFRQNAFDIYMDCPSRERAGWLCDSFFTSRVERMLTGESRVERNFLSNFIMAKELPGLPEGVIPMCYPGDHVNGNFIPNWMMWYVVELKEYLERTGDRTLVDEAKGIVLGTLSYLRGFENSDGLIERLKGWVFVEWSKSNELVQDINYPSNMLYCMFKRTIGELYSDKELIEEADALRTVIRERSRHGLFFCDNSVYEDGELKLSGECTESCQYYAFFTGVATREEDAELWQTLVNDFGPERKESGKWPEIYFANAFIGNYLRLELLCQAGYNKKLEENIRGYFDYMALRTGTLWEHDAPSASCNHGFASHVLVWLKHLGYIK